MWKPTRFVRFEKNFPTSTGTAKIVTDAGKAFIKPLGNPEGSHVLVCEWVAVQLAQCLGIRTFDFAVIGLDEDDEIPLGKDAAKALPGRAFVTRAERGMTWGGSEKQLEGVINKHDITRLIVFDNWIRNRDRCFPPRDPNYDNVFFSTENTDGKTSELVAMDHTHCLDNGNSITIKLSNIDYVKDERLYCAFPSFSVFFDKSVLKETLKQLAQINHDIVNPIVDSVPTEWELSDTAATALKEFLCERAAFLSRKDADFFIAERGKRL